MPNSSLNVASDLTGRHLLFVLHHLPMMVMRGESLALAPITNPVGPGLSEGRLQRPAIPGVNGPRNASGSRPSD